jgi:hypothetical protein
MAHMKRHSVLLPLSVLTISGELLGQTCPDGAPSEAARCAPVAWQASEQGLVFHPSVTPLSAFRFAIGGFYDVIDPQVMSGYEFRVPQLSLDARYGLGLGWSVTAHLNSMFVTSELLVGASFAQSHGPWSYELKASAGVYVGKLGQFSFDVLLLAPEYRPELTLGYDLGSVALSLRGSLILMGPEHVTVGDVSGGLDNSRFFVGHSEMLFVENAMQNGSAWYFGLGLLTTRAYYAFWVMFPDSPALFTYPRMVAGYEF